MATKDISDLEVVEAYIQFKISSGLYGIHDRWPYLILMDWTGECKKELDTGVVLKRDMPDGYSETTWAYNIGKVKDIYERNGGVLVG